MKNKKYIKPKIKERKIYPSFFLSSKFKKIDENTEELILVAVPRS